MTFKSLDNETFFFKLVSISSLISLNPLTMNDRDFYHYNSIAQQQMMEIYAVVNTNQFKIYTIDIYKYMNIKLYNK